MSAELITYLIITHASLGGLALLSGLVAIITKKGSKPHKLAGKLFFWFMLSSAVMAMFISVQEGHENPFLFAIGIFSIYLIVSGRLAIRYKIPEINLIGDRILALCMLIVGLGMIVLPVIMLEKLNIVLTVFGSTGIYLSIQDLIQFRNKEKLAKNWLQAHIGKMMGGYIAAVTAFVVVNQFLPPLLSWLGAPVIGTVFIFYWIRRIS